MEHDSARTDNKIFYDVFQASPIGMAVENLEGYPLFVNPALCSMLGFNEQELRGKRWVDFSPSEDAQKDWTLFQQLRAGSIDHYSVDKRYFRRDGSLLWGRLSMSLMNHSANPLVLAMVEDITDIRRAFEEPFRHAAIVESSDDAIVSMSLDGIIQSWNDGARRMFGYAEQEAIGQSITIIVPSELLSEEKQILKRLEAGERIANYETVRVSKDGKRIHVSLTISPIQDPEGRIIGASKIVRDIDERKHAENELRQSQARLAMEAEALAKLNDRSSRLWRTRSLQEGLDEMLTAVIDLLGADKGHIQVLDPKRGVLTIAAQHGFEEPFLDFFREVSIEDQSGCGRALGLRQRVVIEDVETDAADATLRAVRRAAGYRATVSTPLINSDGELLGMLTTHFGSPHRPPEESLRRLDLYAHQATGFIQRCVAEQAMRESEERFRRVANTAPVVIWMSGTDKLFTYLNQRWAEFSGRPLESGLGTGLTVDIHPEDLERSSGIYTEAFIRRKPFQMQSRFRRHDGEYRWILVSGVPRFNPDGSFAGFIGSCFDVTERKRAEEALSTVNQKLIEAQEQERMRVARELHDDINQRLALLAVNVDGLREHPPTSAAELRKALAKASQQIEDLASDVQALSHRLHSSKLEHLGLERASRSFCTELVDRQGVEIDFQSENIPKDLPYEISLTLFRVLQEALQNAVKHSGSRHLHVSLAGGAHAIELAVRDQGVGFHPEEVLKGRGLGLTSIRERIKMVNGELSIDSQLQRGTTIQARVPLKVSMKSAAVG